MGSRFGAVVMLVVTRFQYVFGAAETWHEGKEWFQIISLTIMMKEELLAKCLIVNRWSRKRDVLGNYTGDDMDNKSRGYGQ